MPRSNKTVTRIAVPLMEAGVPNRNHVVYTEEALRKAMDGIRHGSALLGRISPMEMNVSLRKPTLARPSICRNP